MGKINVLSFAVANLIAAGEVVDRPSSVIKELLENAIDSGATRITVEIQNGGVTYMRVTDNGCGMTAEDLPVAIRRHATSKIREAEDLEKILTLGFRGEALEVIEKKQGERTLALRPGSNLISLTATDSVESLVNRVQILSRDGTAKGSPVEDGASIARYGLFQQMVTESSGRDAAAEARKLLEDNAPAQKITAQVRGNPTLIAGECAVLQEPVTGLYGLCWIDSDTHTWKGGVYTTKLVLNFRSIMDEQEAGRLPDA